MKYGFVYIWYDRKHKRYYVGCRWGAEDDGYICSSSWMKASYKKRPHDFKRRIIARVYTNRADLHEEEYRWLSMMKPEELHGPRYYNIRNHHFSHWTVDAQSRLTVGQKISASPHRREKIAKKAKHRAAKGECFTEYARQRQRVVMKDYKHSDETKRKISKANAGHITTEITRKKIGDTHRGTNKPPLSESRKKHLSNLNTGRLHSDETRAKMSANSRGKHRGTVAVTDRNGINIRINKEYFDKQKKGPMKEWEYVSVTSKESKLRRVKQACQSKLI